MEHCYYKLAIISMRNALCIANPVYTTLDQARAEMEQVKDAVTGDERWHMMYKGFDGVEFEIDTLTLEKYGVSFAIEPVAVTTQSEETA